MDRAVVWEVEIGWFILQRTVEVVGELRFMASQYADSSEVMPLA